MAGSESFARWLSFGIAAFTTVALILGTGCPAWAAPPAQTEPAAAVFDLGRVDVVARAPTAAPGVTVLDEHEVRTLGRPTFAGLFALAPGITASKVGPRNEDTLYLRGFDLRQTPLYVDGIPVYVPYDGYVDLARFLTSDIGEVRVSRGLTSNLYGPNTLGGAINVVSRQPAARFEGLAGLSLRSGEGREADIYLGSQAERWYVAGGGGHLERDSYPLADDWIAVPAQPAGDRLNADARDLKLHATAGYLQPDGSQYTLRWVSQRGEKGNPVYAGTDPRVRPRFWQWPYWDKDSVYGVANLQLGDDTWVRARGYYDTFENALYSYDNASYNTQIRPSSFRSRYDDYTVGTTLEAGWQTTSRLTLRAIGHGKRDVHREANDGEPQRRFEDVLWSGGVEGTAALTPRLSLVAGLSVDRLQTREAQDFQNGVISDFPRGSSEGVNPQASLVYAVGDASRAHFGVSRKTRLPSIKDRFSYRMGQALPNPELAAEHATSVEAGYETRLFGRTRASATAFYIDVEDLVQAVVLRPNLFQQQNVGRVAHTGFEIDTKTELGARVDLGVTYSYLHRDAKSTPAVPLLNVPEHKLQAHVVAAPVERLQLVAAWTVESERRVQNEAGTLLEVSDYGVAEVKAGWRFSPHLAVEGGLSNAFDRNYALADGYPQPGRTAFVALRAAFGRKLP